MRKIRNLIYIFMFIILIVVPCTISSAQENNTIYLTKSSYNEENACWEFKVENESNDRIYYTFKDDPLDKSCQYITSGQVVSVPSSLIKNSYKTLKLFTLNKSGKVTNKMYYRIDRIARNSYLNDLSKLCYSIFDLEDSQYIKAKKLYTWIGENKLYEFYGLTNHEYGAFYGKTSACSGFARLYMDMCSIAGIRCEYVSDAIVDYKYVSWHAWNHIYLDGKMYLVDPTCSGVCFDNEINYSRFCNNGVVNYVITPNYDLSSPKYDR